MKVFGLATLYCYTIHQCFISLKEQIKSINSTEISLIIEAIFSYIFRHYVNNSFVRCQVDSVIQLHLKINDFIL